MIERFQQFVREQALFSTTDRLLVAVSGGLDSVALAHLLHRSEYTFGIAHCNFRLRGKESDGDATFVERLAKQLGVTYHGIEFATETEQLSNESTQMTARRLRYDWLRQVVEEQGYGYLLTGHHLYDSLETLLLNFARSTGLAGLQGIPVKTDWIRRPLLGVGRPELARWVAAEAIAYREDASNATDKYRRNKIRHHIIPVLEALNPSLSATLQGNFTRLREMYTLYEESIEQKTDQLLLPTPTGWRVDRAELSQLAYANTLLFEWLQSYGFTAEQLRQAHAANSGTVLSTESATLYIGTQHLRFVDHALDSPVCAGRIGRVPTTCRVFPTRSLHLMETAVPTTFSGTSNEVYVAAGQLTFPLQVRSWQEGDTFQPLGLQGKSQKLKAYFNNQKLDRWQRDRTPLLLNGDGTIIWVVGQRLDERYKIEPTTQRAIHIVYE